MEDHNDKHEHEKTDKHINFNVNINFNHNESKILDAINKWHEREIEGVIKTLKKTIKDIKSTPVK